MKDLNSILQSAEERIAKMRSVGYEISPAIQKVIEKEIEIAYTSALSTTEDLKEKIEGLRKENERTEKWSDDYYHALTDVLVLLSANKE